VRKWLTARLHADGAGLRLIDRSDDGRDMLFAVSDRTYVHVHVLTSNDRFSPTGLVAAWSGGSSSVSIGPGVQIDWDTRRAGSED
jgi:hypothetical protein